jgi:O-antigen/teichoic acid export membrane protein
LGGNVYALAFGMLLSASSIFISIFGIFRKLLKQLLYSSKGFNYPWKKEIIPLFAKYVVTFSSGYFGFHIYTPMMHYFHGAVYSGKVGISLSLVTAIFNMSNIWIYTVIPKINMLIAKGSWKELDMLFKKRLALSLGTYLASIIGLSVFLKILGNYWIIAKITVRFLPIMPIIMLFFTYFLQVFINAWALYLRGHKQEPFVVLSLILTVWIVTSTYLIGRFLAPTCFFLGFFTAYIWGTPVCYFFLFKKNKAKWHAG